MGIEECRIESENKKRREEKAPVWCGVRVCVVELAWICSRGGQSTNYYCAVVVVGGGGGVGPAAVLPRWVIGPECKGWLWSSGLLERREGAGQCGSSRPVLLARRFFFYLPCVPVVVVQGGSNLRLYV